MNINKYFRQFDIFTRKEFYHIWRDKKTLMVLLLLPLIQLLIFGFALSSDLVDTPTAILDLSKDEVTRRLVRDIDCMPAFKVIGTLDNEDELEQLFRTGKLKIALIFEPNFAQRLERDKKVLLHMIVDASLSSDASTLEGYIQAILLRYNQQEGNLPSFIVPQIHMRYNPQLRSAFHFVPGVIGIVLMLVCSMMASLAIVKEKESGTMEVLLVSPVRPSVIILSKLIPYLLIAMLDVVIILLISIYILNVPVAGNIFLLFISATILAVASLALGMVVSVLTKNQKSAVIISIVGLMLPSITMSGFIFPLRNISVIMYIISYMIPVTSFINIARNIMIKGLGFLDILPELLLLILMAIVLIFIGIRCFKSRLS